MRPLQLRHPSAPTSESVTSWWLTAPREKFTERAAAEHDRMAADPMSRKVPDQIMGRYIGLMRPAE
jgi:hypothetical protein